MNDMEEEIDRTEKISYREINNQVLYKQSNCIYYKTRVHMYSIYSAMKCALNAVG